MFSIFAISVEFATGGIDTNGKRLVSLLPMANLSPVSTAPVLPLAKFAAGVVDTRDAP
jgi:hypothetical protein